ncbi:MAG: pyridoxal 5'-phosphate synthase glutaminase subunit PdxT [Methanomicrobiales archaeon]|nr:pyridoxal 5'-phosphate synthase glutaminase subunit PdxT [Methanomicrobiales archaeon]
MGVRIGVLALQGDVSEHVFAFRRALELLGLENRSEVKAFRDNGSICQLDAIAIPGGESTTICRLIDRRGMRESLVSFDGALFLTCAGLVIAAREVEDAGELVKPLGIMDIGVKRNAFGRQRESFEADLEINGLAEPFHAIFIRAPVIIASGKDVRPIAHVPEGIVGVEQGIHLAFAFHPELSGDLRLHLRFLKGLMGIEWPSAFTDK